jgi:hypothetical protein
MRTCNNLTQIKKVMAKEKGQLVQIKIKGSGVIDYYYVTDDAKYPICNKAGVSLINNDYPFVKLDNYNFTSRRKTA